MYLLKLQFKKCSRKKFRSQTSDIMNRWQNRGGKSQRREEEKREEKIREEQESEERTCGCAKKWESRETLWVPMIRFSKGSKSRLVKAAGAEPSGQMRNEKLHAVAAPSTYPRQNAQSTPT